MGGISISNAFVGPNGYSDNSGSDTTFLSIGNLLLKCFTGKKVRIVSSANNVTLMPLDCGNVSVTGAVTATSGISVSGISTFGSLVSEASGMRSIRHGISNAMVLGSVTIPDIGCTANTRYFFTAHTLGTISLPSAYYASTRTVGTSIVCTSSQATETSTIDWLAIEPV